MEIVNTWDSHDNFGYADWNRIQDNINTIAKTTIYYTDYVEDSFLSEADYVTAFSTVSALAVSCGILDTEMDGLDDVNALISTGYKLTTQDGTIAVTAADINLLETTIGLIYDYETIVGNNETNAAYAGELYVASGTYGRGAF